MSAHAGARASWQAPALAVRPATPVDHPAMIAIAAALPAWFDGDARAWSIPTDLRFHDAFVVQDGRVILGFITVYVVLGRGVIGWLAVAPYYRRRGAGAALVAAAERHCRALGLRELAVCTLDSSVHYPPYEETRRFYTKLGFRVYQRARTDDPVFAEESRWCKSICDDEP